MSQNFALTRDQLAAITADLDQVQSLINEARVLFAHDVETMRKLDEKQDEVDEKRGAITMMRITIEYLES